MTVCLMVKCSFTHSILLAVALIIASLFHKPKQHSIHLFLIAIYLYYKIRSSPAANCLTKASLLSPSQPPVTSESNMCIPYIIPDPQPQKRPRRTGLISQRTPSKSPRLQPAIIEISPQLTYIASPKPDRSPIPPHARLGAMKPPRTPEAAFLEGFIAGEQASRQEEGRAFKPEPQPAEQKPKPKPKPKPAPAPPPQKPEPPTQPPPPQNPANLPPQPAKPIPAPQSPPPPPPPQQPTPPHPTPTSAAPPPTPPSLPTPQNNPAPAPHPPPPQPYPATASTV